MFMSQGIKFVFLLTFSISFAQQGFAQKYNKHVGSKTPVHLIIDQNDEGLNMLYLAMDVPMVGYVDKVEIDLKNSKKGWNKVIAAKKQYYFTYDDKVHLAVPLGKLKEFEGKKRKTVAKIQVKVFNLSGQSLHNQDHTDELVERFSKEYNMDFESEL